LAPWNILTLPLWKISRHSKKFYIPNNAVLVVAGDFEKLLPKNGLKNTLAKSKKAKKLKTKFH
jgi:predicted Zn-dependent peptidase